MSYIVLASDDEQKIIAAEAQISANCGFPNGRGTDKWCDVLFNDDHQLWWIEKPKPQGWTDGVDSFTQEEMMAGVVNVEEQEWD